MNIVSKMSVGDFQFDNSQAEVKKKLKQFDKIEIGESVVMEFVYPSIYIFDVSMHIVFSESGANIRYFEIDSDIFHNGINLFKERFSSLMKIYKKLDKKFTSDDSSFDCPELGISVNFCDGANQILVYSDEYKNETPISADDILNYYLG